MDISTMIGEYKFNFRVSALIKKDNKILLHHNIKESHYTLPGGRVTIGETTIQALQREILEEIGLKTEFVKEILLLENFFTLRDEKKYHEILITYEMKFLDKDAYEQEKIIGIEEGKNLEFIWKDINELNEKNFKPKKLLEEIKNPTGFKDEINDERKSK